MNTLYKTVEVVENGQYTFEQPPKTKGKKFIKWQDKDQVESSYKAGQTIDVNRDISVKAVFEDVEEYTVTLKVDGIPYKTDYVEAGSSYTFTVAPPKPEKYFIGWESEDLLPNNLQYNTSSSMIRSVTHIQPGTTIRVNSDLVYDADYRKENEKVENKYYEGGTIKVPNSQPANIKIPLGKVFGGFKSIISGISSIFKPGALITIQPGIKLEAVWVDELTIKLYDENENIIDTPDRAYMFQSSN